MRSSWGTVVSGACLALAVTALSVPVTTVWARGRSTTPRQENVALTGSLTIGWTGSPARGCAAAGLCGVSGSIQMLIGGIATSGPAGQVPLELGDTTAAARVQMTAADGTVTTCADYVPVDFVVAVRRLGRRLRAHVNRAMSLALPSAGRCAGPTAADLAALTLPSRPLGAHGYDMSGQSSFAAGPFAVTAVSTVQAHVSFGRAGTAGATGAGSSSGSASGFGSPGKSRRALEESVILDYRVTGLTGSLQTAFAALAPPLCGALDACGTSGRLTQSFATGGRVSFAGTRLVRRRVGQRGALADLRHGRLQLFDTFVAHSIRAATDETLASAGGPGCTDRAGSTLVAQSDRPRRATDALLLSASAVGFPGGAVDPFRTRCPGPSAADILGPDSGPLATATITASELGHRRLSITFRNRGTFSGLAYSGKRSGTLVLSLTLLRERGVTRPVSLFAGEPVFPIS